MSLPGYVAHFNQLAAPAAAALDATGAKLRIPVTDNLKVVEYGVRIVGATASGTAMVVKLQGEPIAGGAAVDLVVGTTPATVTQGKSLVKRCDADVFKKDYAFVVVNVSTAAAAGATGIVFAKIVAGGSGAADDNDVVAG
jgi:hypothetical protein